MSDVPVAIPPTPFDAPTNPYVTVAKFREDFPVFADAAIYTDANVQIFLDMAGLMVSPAVWSRLTVTGQELLTAHFLALQRYNTVRLASSAGGPGAEPLCEPAMPDSAELEGRSALRYCATRRSSLSITAPRSR